MIVPRHVLGQGQTPPSDLVNIAIVGINGMGAVNAQAVMSQNIVAICDVRRWAARWPARRVGRVAPAAASATRRAARPRSRGGRRRPRRRRRRSRGTYSGPSQLQRAADEKWRPAQGTHEPEAICRRAAAAPEDAIATTARCSRSRKTSTR